MGGLPGPPLLAQDYSAPVSSESSSLGSTTISGTPQMQR